MPEGKAKHLIEMEALEVRYGPFRALKGIDVKVEPGAVGLLGPNGAGKSTLVKALLGLLRLHGGRGRVMDMDVSREGLAIRARVGYMPEGDCHIPGLNGFEYVAFCGRLCGMPEKDARRRAHEVLEYVGLGEARYRPVDGYSTGMRQRVKLAQALVHDPPFLILDEPTNGFDPKGREEVLSLIYDVSHRKGMNLLLSSHLLYDVERTCDAVLLLRDGELLRYGRIKDLKAREERVVSLEFKGEGTDFSAAAAEKGWRFEARERRRGMLVLPKDVSCREVIACARAAGVQLRSYLPSEETLEELFMKTVAE